MVPIACSKKASLVIFIHSGLSTSQTGPLASTAMASLFIIYRSQIEHFITRHHQSKDYVLDKLITMMINIEIKGNAFNYFVSQFHPIYSKTSDHQNKSQMQPLPLFLSYPPFNPIKMSDLLLPMIQLVNFGVHLKFKT